jgi:predicted  nucleic acid-binding Zn-ribbon protein
MQSNTDTPELNCVRCGDAYGDVDEATGFCPDCFKSEMGDWPEEAARPPVQTDGLDAFAQLHRDWEASLRREAALQRSNAEKDEALLGCGAALNSFIYIIAQRFDGDCTYYWMRDPTREEAQAAMIANNNASKALSHSSETSNG